LLIVSNAGFAAPGDEHWDTAFGWPGTSNTVQGLAWHRGKLYTGGIPAGTSLTNSTLNVWDGTRWSTLGRFSGSTAIIYDLAFLGDVLFAGGLFTNVDGVATSGLAQWDGNAWSSVAQRLVVVRGGRGMSSGVTSLTLSLSDVTPLEDPLRRSSGARGRVLPCNVTQSCTVTTECPHAARRGQQTIGEPPETVRPAARFASKILTRVPGNQG